MTHARVWILAAAAAATLLSVSCKEQKAPETSGEQTKASDPFTAALVDAEFVRYSISIGGGGDLTYETLRFDAGGGWEGAATLRLADDPYSCTESGSWSYEAGSPVDSTTARLLMVMDRTDCPGREAPRKWKVEIRLKTKGDRPVIVDL